MSDTHLNVTGDIATPEVPLFQVKRFAGRKEFLIPSDMYTNARMGRTKYQEWDSFMKHPDLQDLIKRALYKDGECYLTCNLTGASVKLTHDIKPRSTTYFTRTDEAMDMGTVQVSDEFLKEGTEVDLGEEQYYLAAYDYYTELGNDDYNSDLFAQIVLAFIMEVENDEVGLTQTELFKAAKQNVIDGSRELGLGLPSPEVIADAQKYIVNNFSIVDNDDDLEYTDDLDEALDALGKEDKDIDNDGEVDAQDKYLANRRKKITKDIKLEEKLSKDDPVKVWIDDFIKSDDIRFEGKSKEERIQMALGAWYAAQD